MNILITGASGFTGKHFKVFAEAAGHRVMELTADLKDRNAVRVEVTRLCPEAVVHLAAISFVGHENSADFYSVNVIGTMHLLEALSALHEKPRKVLLAGSAHVYGNSKVSPIMELQCPEPRSHYAISKLAMEYMSRGYMDILPIIITRPFNYTGPGQAEHFVIPKLVSHFARQADSIDLGNLNVEREFNDVRMVCDAYLKLLESPHSSEIYNICTAKTYSVAGIIAILEQLSGHKITIRNNSTLMRKAEINQLCGDPTKLRNAVGQITDFPIEDTLKWMLEAYLDRSFDQQTKVKI